MTRRFPVADSELYFGFDRFTCRGSLLQHETFHNQWLGATTQKRRRARKLLGERELEGVSHVSMVLFSNMLGVSSWESSRGQPWLGIFNSTRVYCPNGWQMWGVVS